MPDIGNARQGRRTPALTPSHAAAGPACLVVLEGPARGRKYRLGPVDDDDPDQQVIIGRSVEADIPIDDAEVSRAHASIRRTKAGAVMIEDMGSRNGTFLNGVPVETAEISFGDKLRLGSNVVLVLTHYDPVEQQLLQRQRLETLGRLGAGIAHDLNNMQQVVASTVAFMRDMDPKTPLGQEVLRECLHDLQTASTRSKELAGCLLGYARSGNEAHADVDMSEVCREVVKLASRTFGLGIELRSEIAGKLRVIGSSAELHQVVMNLCVNARDAMPQGGKLTVRARLQSNEDLEDLELPSQGPHVEVSVRDTGTGMDAVARDRAFDAFFTTKARGEGSGLGLAMVRDIVISHGGKVEFDTQANKGTTFRVFLPAATQASRKPFLTQPQTVEDFSRSQTILLVEDEPLVRKSLSRVLRGVGYKVLVAADGVEAVKRYGEAETRPSLVILDLEMPAMAGPETLGQLRELNTNVAVMFITGHSEDMLERAARAYGGGVGLLRKPFSSEQLLDATAEALRAPTDAVEDTLQRKPPG